MEDCIFCQIVSGKAPASVVYEDEATIAFMDIGHVNPGHTIVAVKTHVPDIFGLDGDLAAAAFRTVALVAQAVRRAFAPEGLTVLQANGRASWQTVFHFHLHVLPRHTDDGVGLTWPAKRPPREELEANAARIRQALAAGGD